MLFMVQRGYMLFRRIIWMPRRVVYCSGGLYAVQEGYIDVQEGYMVFRGVILMFRRVICCSVQVGYLDR